MKRRDFLRTGSVLTVFAASTPIPFLRCGAKDESSNTIVAELIRQTDDRIPQWLQRQELELTSDVLGAIKNDFGIASAGLTSAFVRDVVCAFISSGSRWYRSTELLQPLHLAANALLRLQHADGTIDLHSTNFRSPPDTAFVMEWVCGTCDILRTVALPELQPTQQILEAFVLSAATALVQGGIHTPNHRWVVCMALARAYSLFPKQSYLNRIDRWLAEHIDIDPDGQYTEKSSSIYSPLTDRCLITVARLVNRPKLYEPVRKNLQMTMYYIHPNGEVVTEASKRQDKYQYGSMAPYYYPYRYMALLDSDAMFSAMASWIERTSLETLSNNLLYFLEDPFLGGALPEPAPLPTSYCKHFKHSELARIRRGHISATILAQNYTVFSFRKGEAILRAVRLASAFFGKGQFEGETLEFMDGQFVMSQELQGPYYQPYPEEEIPEDGDWEKMDRENRPQSNIQHLKSTVTVTEDNGRFELDIELRGTDRVPVALELAFRHGGKLRGVERVPNVKDAFFLKRDYGSYSYASQTITFGRGCHAHEWTQLRGAEPKLDALCVYLTGFTPFVCKLHVF